MIYRRTAGYTSDEIVRSTLTELILVFLFFFLILFAAQNAQTLEDLRVDRFLEPAPPKPQAVVLPLPEPEADPQVQINALTGRLRQAQEDLERAEGQITTYRNANIQLQIDVEDIRTSLEGEQSKSEALEERIESLQASNFGLVGEVLRHRGQSNALRRDLNVLENENGRLEDQIERGRNPFPPAIQITDADKYFFVSNEATIGDDFNTYIRKQIVEGIRKVARDYDVDTVEIIGHTDGRRVNKGSRALDEALLSVILGTVEAPDVVFSDNVGLGMLRAAAVASILREELSDTGLRVLSYSAGQAITPTGALADEDDRADVPERRRLEIRLTKWPETENRMPLVNNDDSR